MIHIETEACVFFEKCLEAVLFWEGHDLITDDIEDAGGLTRWGITYRTLAAWKEVSPNEITLGHMKELTKSEAAEIYQLNYFEEMGCSEFSPAVALCVFDTAVNLGVPKAARLLQAVSGAKSDGVVGPQTIKAVNAADEEGLLLDLMGKRVLYYMNRPSFDRFGFGWIRRVLSIHSQAINEKGEDDGN